VSPATGRIQYRISNVGEVLPAGGKVFTMLDFDDVYMDIYLPTAAAGRARIGSDARLVLDAYSNVVVPAHVSFIATQSQFTPKAVETKEERDKLMFRVKVRVDPDFLRPRIAEVRTGLPGVAY
jgi:HlyD family secretion protein